MKHTFSALLAALVTVPAYAAPLNPDDWKTNDAAKNCFVFNSDGSLTATGNTSGNELHYIIKEMGANLMQNGSGMSVTLQFDTESFLEDTGTEFYIAFHNDNSEIDGNDFFKRITIRNTDSQLNLYDDPVQFDKYYTLDSGESFTEVEVDFIIENNVLCCTYSVNGTASERFAMKEVNPSLDWKPSFGISNTETNIFTVTDVSFTPIPEPATASFLLSLLVIFGMTVRRRRK